MLRPMMFWKLVLFVLLTNFSFCVSVGNNACNNFEDYQRAQTSKNCWYDPDMELKTPQLIEKYTGYVETHDVVTQDGYILTVFRMNPNRSPKGVVLFYHPILVDSRIWMSQRNESTALILWREGYDVWLANQRGTYHSERHLNLSIQHPDFWNFSFHETGQYDVAAIVNLVRSRTGGRSKIVFIGHSMGTTNGLVYASLRPEEAYNSIGTFVLLSTGVYYKHATSVALRPFVLAPSFKPLLDYLQLQALIPLLPTIIQIGKWLFRTFPWSPWITNWLMSVSFGWNPDEADPAWVNFDAAEHLRNTNWKMMCHYGQMIQKKDRFQMYDHGLAKNRALYGTESPPLYPIWNIRVPVVMMTGGKDQLTTIEDARLLYSRLPQAAQRLGIAPIELPGMNHMDVQNGKHRTQILVTNLLKILNKVSIFS